MIRKDCLAQGILKPNQFNLAHCSDLLKPCQNWGHLGSNQIDLLSLDSACYCVKRKPSSYISLSAKISLDNLSNHFKSLLMNKLSIKS